MKKLIMYTILFSIFFSRSFAYWDNELIADEVCNDEILNDVSNYVMSSDSKKIAYISYKDWKYIVIENWKKIWKEYDNIYNIVYSPDWKSILFSVLKDWHEYIVKDWHEYIINEWQEYSNSELPIFSPDWEKFVYKAKEKWELIIIINWSIQDEKMNKIKKKEFFVINWVEWKKYDKVSNFLYSPDWKSYTYLVSNNGKSYYVKDWNELWKEYDNTFNITYSPDWKSYAYVAEKEGKEFLIKDWKQIWDKYEEIYWFNYWLSWNKIVYLALNNNKYHIIKDWIETEDKYDSIKTKFIFSPDWKSYAYIWSSNWKTYIYKDWIKLEELNIPVNVEMTSVWYPEFILPYSFEFSKVWTGFTYVIKDEFFGEYIFKNWEKSEKYDYIYKVIYSKEQKNVDFIYKNKDRIYIIEDWIKKDISLENKTIIYYRKKTNDADLYYYILNSEVDYENSYYFKLSKDSSSYWFIAEKEWKSFIINDWIILWDEYNLVSSLNYFNNWKSLVYSAEKDWKNYIIKHGCDWNKTKLDIVNNNTSIKNYSNQLIISKTNLLKTVKWRSQIKTIDAIVSKYSKEKLNNIFNYTITKKAELGKKINSNYYSLLDYLEASIALKLWK